MFKIRKESDVPLYLQLINSIKNRISDGTFKENEKIPSELSICSEYNLSRTTVRLALDALEKEGLIYKVRGKGSYISSQKIYQDRSKFSKFYDDIKNMGKIPYSRIISAKVEESDEEIIEKMNLKKGDKIFKLIWSRYGNEEALIYETIYLNYSLIEGIEEINLREKKLYEILFEKYGIKISHGRELFFPCKLNASEAKYLELDEGDLGMKVERVLYQEDKVVEYTRSTVRGDRFIYTINF